MQQIEIKAICFDKDGTLFDFSATWEAWAAAFLLRVAQGDAARAAQAGATIGFDLEKCKFSPHSIVIAGTAGEIALALASSFPEMAQADILALINAEAAIAPQKPAVPLHPLLSQFRESGLKLGVATNDSEGPARAHLDQAGVTNLFDFIAGYDSGYGAKPAAGQLLAFAAAVDVPVEQIVMVGDSTHDLHAGRAAGMRTIAVLTGAAKAPALAPFADVVLNNIGEIPEWLAAQSSA